MGNNNFVLTSNRDEKYLRKPALDPRIHLVDDTLVVFPKDQQAEGTWIATSGNPFTLCLLNGAFQKHQSKSNYKKSRGLVLLDFFKYNNVQRFLREYDFNGIEPFTLLLLDTNLKIHLTEARWDGSQLHQTEIDTQEPHIWSSATLYTPETVKQRENWFRDFLMSHPDYMGYSILDFHHLGGKGDTSNSLVMDRENEVRTVSITSILRQNNHLQMTYKDVVNQKIYSRRIC